MEFFDRTKAILFNPKEEWTIIEAENASHAKVFAGHLLILALIPAAAIFFNYWWSWNSTYTDAINQFGGYSKDMANMLKERMPFDAKWGIITAVQQLVIILGGAYLTAVVINAFSDQFGSAKDFNRAFALVAYSYTPLCVAGILYIYSPLAFLVPLAGCYGLYLLYLGSESQLKPAADKKVICFIISLIAVIVVWAVLSKIVPTITQSILIEQAKNDGLRNLQNLMPR